MVFIRTMKGLIGFIAVLGMIVAEIINPFAAILFISILLVLSLVWRRIDASRARLVLDVTGFKQVPSYMTEEPARSERPFSQAEIKEKEENLRNICALAEAQGEISGNDVHELLNCTDIVAERYLCELEREGKLMLAKREREASIYVPHLHFA